MLNSLRNHRYLAVLVFVFNFNCLMTMRANAALKVIGDWENSGNANSGVASDYWLDWGNQVYANDFPGRYSFSTTTGVTLGSSSLHVTASGYTQDLAIKLQNNPADTVANHQSLLPDFFSNRALAIDITYPAQVAAPGDQSGYQQIYGVALNVQGYGFVEQGNANPLPGTNVGYGNGMGGELPTATHTYTLVINYGSHLDVNGGPIITSGATAATYAEFIFSTNGDSNHSDFYFDNARLFTPGDLNNDGAIDVKDVSSMMSALANMPDYANSLGLPLSDIKALGDVNGDGAFNNLDIQNLIAQLANNGASIAPTVSTVPEPTSLILTGLATPACLWAVRRRG
jgi:Dockerin type I domain